MKRTPLTRRTPLSRGPGPKRRTRLAAVNPARRAALREAQFGEHAETVRRLPCCACRPDAYREDHSLPSPLPYRVSEASHTKTRGSGGKRDKQVPHCRAHHRQFEEWGREELRNARHEEEFGVHTGRLAARLWAEYGGSR